MNITLLYTTIGLEAPYTPQNMLNGIYLGTMEVQQVAKNTTLVSFEQVRKRSGGLLRKNEDFSVFFRQENGDWLQTSSDLEYIPVFNSVILAKFLPLNYPCGLNNNSSDDASSLLSGDDVFSDILSEILNIKKKNSSNVVVPSSSSSTVNVATTGGGANNNNNNNITNIMVDELSEAAIKARSAVTAFGSQFTNWAKEATSKIQSVTELALENTLVTETIDHTYKVKLVKKLAEGGFSEVFVVKIISGGGGSLDANSNYALKKCKAQTKEHLAQFQKEINAHKLLKNQPYVLNLLASDVMQSSENRGLVIVRFLFPLCDGGSWYDLVYQKGQAEKEAVRIGLGAAKGLLAMHEKAKLLHRDVKPHNILLKSNGEPVLMDLGSCCALPMIVSSKSAASNLVEECAAFCSAPYRAPELYEPTTPSEIGGEVDVWSFGSTLFAVTFGKGWSPFEDAAQGVLKLAILNAKVKYPTTASNEKYSYSKEFKNLIESILIRDPKQRPMLETVISKLEALAAS